MTEPCSVQQASIKALAVFLQAQFDADARFGPDVPDTHVVVREEWPAPGDNLPPRCISILQAGPRQDTFTMNEPELLKSTQLPNNQGEFTWDIKAFLQPVQLDVWAKYDAQRDEVLDALDTFLNMGPLFTLGEGDITRDGPLLRLDPNTRHEGMVDYTFDGPRNIDGEDSSREYQYRALVMGECEGTLTFTAKTARLAVVKLQMALGPLGQGAANFTANAKPAGGFEITSSSL